MEFGESMDVLKAILPAAVAYEYSVILTSFCDMNQKIYI